MLSVLVHVSSFLLQKTIEQLRSEVVENEATPSCVFTGCTVQERSDNFSVLGCGCITGSFVFEIACPKSGGKDVARPPTTSRGRSISCSIQQLSSICTNRSVKPNSSR